MGAWISTFEVPASGCVDWEVLLSFCLYATHTLSLARSLYLSFLSPSLSFLPLYLSLSLSLPPSLSFSLVDGEVGEEKNPEAQTLVNSTLCD